MLENKAHRETLAHLGALKDVWLYRNNRRVKEVSYRETEADDVSYTVTIRKLTRQPSTE